MWLLLWGCTDWGLNSSSLIREKISCVVLAILAMFVFICTIFSACTLADSSVNSSILLLILMFSSARSA